MCNSLQEVDLHDSVLKNADQTVSTLTLLDCLEKWCEEEKLSERDPWYCKNCKQHRQATKRLDLWKLPPVLIIHLKRFSYGTHIFRDKIDTLVDYPVTDLDLSKFVQGSQDELPIYDLFAVSVAPSICGIAYFLLRITTGGWAVGTTLHTARMQSMANGITLMIAT